VGDTVFANNQAVACKASNGKSIAAFPDVCLTPPTPPAGPIPVPYPNTAMASDLADGSTSVKVEKKPVLLGAKSNFSTSTGDEAGTQGGNVVTHKTKGKAYFAVYSFDVKVEGEGVARNLDMTTHNHASPVPGTPPWVHVSSAMFASGKECDGVDTQFKLIPYKKGCPRGETPHHVIPHRQMKGRGGATYTHGDAPCICVTGRNQHTKQHGKCHAICDPPELDAHKARRTYTYEEASTNGAKACAGAQNSDKPLDENSDEFKCIKAQLDAYYKDDCNMKDDSPMKKSGKRGKNIPSKKASTSTAP
jgi:Domain of unknown function (DUF4150)